MSPREEWGGVRLVLPRRFGRPSAVRITVDTAHSTWGVNAGAIPSASLSLRLGTGTNQRLGKSGQRKPIAITRTDERGALLPVSAILGPAGTGARAPHPTLDRAPLFPPLDRSSAPRREFPGILVKHLARYLLASVDLSEWAHRRPSTVAVDRRPALRSRCDTSFSSGTELPFPPPPPPPPPLRQTCPTSDIKVSRGLDVVWVGGWVLSRLACLAAAAGRAVAGMPPPPPPPRCLFYHAKSFFYEAPTHQRVRS